MRIVKRDQFLKLPENTLYRKFRPNVFEGIEMKVSAPEYKYGYIYIPIDIVDAPGSDEADELLDEARYNGKKFMIDYEASFRRSGVDPEDQLYIIYDKDDIQCLINFLEIAYNSAT